jgi:protein-tyrosine-phosphatase
MISGQLGGRLREELQQGVELDAGRRHVVFLCTGNAARSVMAGAALARSGAARITTAGTHVIEGQPMSWRTRSALEGVGLAADGHRSRQIRERDLDQADLVVGLAREHVEHVRRRHPSAAARTATLRRLCRDLPGRSGTLPERLAALRLDEVELEPWEDVDDPAGGDVEDFHGCAADIVELVACLERELA